MGDVIVKLEIVPEGADTDLTALSVQCDDIISKHGKVNSKEEKLMAFGMKMLVFTVIMKEMAGGTDPLERALEGVAGVSRAEAVDARKLM